MKHVGGAQMLKEPQLFQFNPIFGTVILKFELLSAKTFGSDILVG